MYTTLKIYDRAGNVFTTAPLQRHIAEDIIEKVRLQDHNTFMVIPGVRGIRSIRIHANSVIAATEVDL